MATNEKKHTINLRHAVEVLWDKKIAFLITWIVTFVVSCIIILPVPRYHRCSISMAPEDNNDNFGSGLSSLAASFGFNFAKGGDDAISPTLYPDLFKSTGFMVSLWDIEVSTKDGALTTNYYTYMAAHQKKNPLFYPLRTSAQFVRETIFRKPAPTPSQIDTVDAFRLNRFDTDVLKAMRKNIQCSVDKKTDVVTLSIKDQDPLIAATMAVEIEKRLQDFITDYRTKKSRIDFEYYSQLTDSAYHAYCHARKAYCAYADTHINPTMAHEQDMLDDLKNEVEMKLSIYTAMSSRKEASRAKVQERTPVFTTIQTATVPVKPAGPKRMIFVASMLVMVTLGLMLWLFREKIIEILFTDPE